MAELEPSYPDLELWLCDALEAQFDGLHADNQTPPNLADALPFARVQRTGGRDDGVTDLCRATVDVFHATRGQVHELAEQVRQYLTVPAGGRVVNGVAVDLITTDSAPTEVPWSDNPAVRRYTAAYSLTARR